MTLLCAKLVHIFGLNIVCKHQIRNLLYISALKLSCTFELFSFVDSIAAIQKAL